MLYPKSLEQISQICNNYPLSMATWHVKGSGECLFAFSLQMNCFFDASLRMKKLKNLCMD